MQEERRKMALGIQKAPLVFKNATIVDVFTGQLREADVAVDGDCIVGVGSFAGEEEISLAGKWLIPGLVDAHMHFESSLVSPRLFLERILPCGTTTVIADPHEIVNVLGTVGMEYMYRETEDVPARVHWMLPSCVPANALETSGAAFGAVQMRQLARKHQPFGLGEVMDVNAVLTGEPEMAEKLALYSRVDGHAPGLTEKLLGVYRLAGVQTDHECSTFKQAMERVEQGFYVQIREGTAAKNLRAIVADIVRTGVPTDRFLFCTDDKHLDDVRREGHINHNVRLAIECGLPPVTAIRMATLNPAQAYGLTGFGAIAPGYTADLVVLDDLNTVAVNRVYVGGKLVCQAGEPFELPGRAAHGKLCRTVHLPELSAKRLELPVHPDFPVIEIVPGEITTHKRLLTLPERNGLFQPADDLLKIAVVERHGHTDHVAVGVVKGIGLKGGAIGSTIAHDSHNLILVGDSDADMLAAARELGACQGGYTLVADGVPVMTQALPIAGLFTDSRTEDVEGKVAAMKELARAMGVRPDIDPFMTLSFLSLPVIPELRIIDAGIYDVCSGEIL